MMTKYKVVETEIRGLLIFEPTEQDDIQGFSLKTDSNQYLLEAGIEDEFVLENSVKATRGELRGLHFQRKQTQGVLVSVTSGAVLYVAVDLRADSYTNGAPWSVELSAENERMYWIPEQFAHGFLSLESNTEVSFKYTDLENRKEVAGIKWDDHIISIDWQFERYDIDEKYLKISDRDKNFPGFRSWNPKTLWK